MDPPLMVAMAAPLTIGWAMSVLEHHPELFDKGDRTVFHDLDVAIHTAMDERARAS